MIRRQPIEIEGPDGTIYEFPEGTPDSVIRQAMAREYTESSQRALGAWMEAAQQMRGRGEKDKAERDYITFPEPEEAGTDERRAA